MQAELLRAIQGLLDSQPVLSAAVVVEGEPVAALLPFVVSADYTKLYVQASGLAKHSKGLQPGARVGVLVHAPATPDRDPMQLPRLAVQAAVQRVEPGSEEWRAAASRLVARFPAAATTLALPDFTLYSLALDRGRYVEGFARAVNVGAETFMAMGSRANPSRDESATP